MKNINIGIVNQYLSNRLCESYITNNSIHLDTKLQLNEFIDIVKSSPILQLEFKVFNNIENKYIDDQLIATRYIDNNIKLFEIYTIDEIDNERLKIKKFINESKINFNDPKVKLYKAIDELIRESIIDYSDVDVDKIHETFAYILNHIRQPKKELDYINEAINEDVIEIAVEKFNQKYSNIDEIDKKLLKVLIKSTNDEKQKLLETYKSEIIEILKTINSDNIDDNISKAITKINEMDNNHKQLVNNIIELHEFKRDII